MLAVRTKKPTAARPRDRYGREIPFPHELPDTDGKPTESLFHVQEADLLDDQLRANWPAGRLFCAGNICVHHSLEQVLNKDFLGPNFFVVLDPRDNPKRECWPVWDEDDRFPDMILEVQSPKTRKRDVTAKKDIYEKVCRTPDCICYDPPNDKLQGWHLVADVYQPIPLTEDGLWCESFKLHLRRWRGTYSGKTQIWLRFCDRDEKMLPRWKSCGTLTGKKSDC